MRLCVAVLAFGLAAASAAGQALPDYVDYLPLPFVSHGCRWAGSPPGDTSRLFVLHANGDVRVIDIARPPGQLPVYTLRSTRFLTGSTSQARSMEFAPDYASSGRFYVATEYLTGGHGTVINEYRVSANDPNVATPTPLRTVLKVENLYGDHAVGSMHFGRDGMLYIGVGDHDSGNLAQAVNQVYGKFIRIDVTAGTDDYPADPLRNYHVPADNPLVDRAGAAPEIWHIGLRNPWRWSFDRWNGDMWTCDVGELRAGEIDRVPGSGTPYSNFGWSTLDGTVPQSGTNPLNPDFTLADLVPPLLSINREDGQCATIGGVLYRGNDIRPWRGRFVWGDACNGRVYSAGFDGASLGAPQDHTPQLRHAVTGATGSFAPISMIAEDGAGELYILLSGSTDGQGGWVYRIVAAGTQPPLADVGQPGGLVGPDGLLDNNDFIAFITLFFNNDPGADMGTAGGLRGVDQVLDNNDFIAFIDAFFTGN